MGESSSGTSHDLPAAKAAWPKYSLLISILLWLLAWELIAWFVPVQTRVIIQSDFLAGFSPDGKTLVTTEGNRDPALPGTIFHLWDTETGQNLGTLGDEKTNILPNVVFSSQRNLLSEIAFPWNALETYVLYDLTTHQKTCSIQLTRNNVEFVTTLCFSPDGRTLVYDTDRQDKGDLWLVDVATGEVRAHLEGGTYGYITGFVVSQDGSTLATTETKHIPDDNIPDDEKLIVLDTATGKTLATFQEYAVDALHLALSPDGTKLAAYCLIGHSKTGDFTDRQVRVWDVATGKQIVSFKTDGFTDGFPEFLPDSKGLALSDEDGARFCDLSTGREFAEVKISPAPYIGLPKPIPGTQLLAVPARYHSKPSLFLQWCATFLGIKSLGEERDGHEVAFLDTRTGAKVAAIVRPGIPTVKIFPDGKTLALEFGENDESFIEIWDIPPRRPLQWVLVFLAIPTVVSLIALRRLKLALTRS